MSFVSTHSRPKAAANVLGKKMPTKSVSTHSRPKAAASIRLISVLMNSAFQHTAARRRLLGLKSLDGMIDTVSTHSRSKAAAIFNVHITIIHFVSTHSRPKAAAANRI